MQRSEAFGFAIHNGMRCVPVLLACAILGCAGNSLVDVTGDVSLDDKPVEKGVISFWPEDGKGPTAQAVIEQGKYKAAVAPGAKKVGIEAVKQTGEARPSGPNGPAVPIHAVISPEKYRDPIKTDLRCDVDAATTTHSFRLKSS